MKNGLLAVSRILAAISTLALWIAGAGLVAMTVIVAYQVFMRYVVNAAEPFVVPAVERDRSRAPFADLVRQDPSA